MPLPDNYFRDKTPAEIVALIAAGTPTLATISSWTVEEQIHVGWLGNPFVDILFSLTSAGVWIARTDPSGRLTEANSATISEYEASIMKVVRGPTVSGSTSVNSTVNQNLMRRIAQIPLTEAGGAIAAAVIGTGIASYKLHMILKKLYYPEGSTDASHTITIASEAGGAITGPTTIIQGGTAFCFTYFGAVVAGTPTDGVLIYNTTADKDITFAAADLTTDGVHHTYYLEVEYWLEA